MLKRLLLHLLLHLLFHLLLHLFISYIGPVIVTIVETKLKLATIIIDGFCTTCRMSLEESWRHHVSTYLVLLNMGGLSS